ncbi:MAG: LapA family protein [Acidobacteria bacterium]|nr:LapA family protein [Acidobacteriota bacterium]
MQVFLFVALGVALFAVMFALQNIAPVTVAFFTWTFEGSLALLLFVTLIVGALVSVLASIPTLVKGKWAVTSLKKRIAAIEVELQETKLAAAQRPPVPRGPGPSREPGAGPPRITPPPA